MKFKTNYLVIPLITMAVSVIGSYFTSLGMAWYDTELIKPALNATGLFVWHRLDNDFYPHSNLSHYSVEQKKRDFHSQYSYS